MKKHFLLFAGSAILFASCGSNETKNEGQTQAQIDSAVNAKVAEHDAEMAAKSDSALKAAEAAKAAAAEAEAAAKAASKEAKKGSGKTTKTTEVKTHSGSGMQIMNQTATQPKPNVSNPKDARFHEGENAQTAPAPNPASTQKKADRFK